MEKNIYYLYFVCFVVASILTQRRLSYINHQLYLFESLNFSSRIKKICSVVFEFDAYRLTDVSGNVFYIVFKGCHKY